MVWTLVCSTPAHLKPGETLILGGKWGDGDGGKGRSGERGGESESVEYGVHLFSINKKIRASSTLGSRGIVLKTHMLSKGGEVGERVLHCTYGGRVSF